MQAIEMPIKPRRSVIRTPARLAVVPMLVAVAVMMLVSMVSAAAPVPDENGANDEPGQKDLTQLTIDYTGLTATPKYVDVTWNWDEIAWSGANTGDACALFDTDNDLYANYAYCVTIGGSPGVELDERLYECEADNRVDRCAGPVLVTEPYSSTCTVAQSATDPFGPSAPKGPGAAYPNDTTATCRLFLSDISSLDEADLLNVCSYPSQEPNSDPSDCVLIPRDGKVIVVKQTDPDGSLEDFGFNASFDAGDPPDFLLSDGQSFEMPVVAGTYTVTEIAEPGWDLTDIACNDTNSTDSGSTATYVVAAGETVTCTFTNTKRGQIIVDKVTVPAGDAQLFTFDPSWSADDFQLADATTPHNSGALVPGTYNVAETVPAGWDLTSATCSDGSAVTAINLAAGETVTCTFTNTKRGSVDVIKTVSGGAPNGATFTFDIRTGASLTSTGTVVASTTTDAVTGLADFSGALFVPGNYQFCETNMMPGWDTSLDDGAYGPHFVPGGSLPDPDNSTVCVNFTLDAGEEQVFSVNNVPPPGGDARTIGFWKNWTSCDGNGNQDHVLDEILASFPNGGVLIGDLFVDTCGEAVSLLNKSALNGKKQASDAAYALASQLLAAKLNVQATAGTCQAALDAITNGQALLDRIGFDGSRTYLGPKSKGQALADRNEALTYAATLDAYNNNELCP